MKKIHAKTKLAELLKEFPFLKPFLISYNKEFGLLNNKVMMMSVGRFATLQMVADKGGIDTQKLIRDIAEKIHMETGRQIPVDDSPALSIKEQKNRLKKAILALHKGASVQDVMEEFGDELQEVDQKLIPVLEQELVRDGLSIDAVQDMCDLHVEMFKKALENQSVVKAPKGHPIDIYMRENREIERLAQRFSLVTRRLSKQETEQLWQQTQEAFQALARVVLHFERIENALFPLLEKHGNATVPQVMWGVHDLIRGLIKQVEKAITERSVEKLKPLSPELVYQIVQMVYKENKVLFPLANDLLSDQEWKTEQEAESNMDFILEEISNGGIKPEATKIAGTDLEVKIHGSTDGQIMLETGRLSLSELESLFKALPVDITFVDANDRVKFFSEYRGGRVFPRVKSVLGREVQMCHPRKSVHIVNRILQGFRDGTKDSADFWIEHQGRFLYIRYFAVRDAKGNYLGTLEVTQDVTEIRNLQGEKRLLDWGNN